MYLPRLSKYPERSMMVSRRIAAIALATLIVSVGYAKTVSVSPLYTASTSGWGSTAFASIQTAINTVSSGDVISIGAGTYSEQLSIGKSVSLIGVNRDAVILDLRSKTNHGITTGANNITLASFTLLAPSSTSGGSGLKIQGVIANNPLNTPNGTAAVNIVVNDMTIQDAFQAGIDFNGVNGGSITNVTITGSQKGQAIGLTDCRNITLSGITSSGNYYAGIRLTANGTYFPGGIDHITLGAGNSISEQYAQVYSERDNAAYLVTNLDFSASDLKYRVIVNGSRTVVYVPTIAMALSDISANGTGGTIADISVEHYYVTGGLTIQNAINNAPSGATYTIDPGTYNETVTITKDAAFLPVAFTARPSPFLATPGLIITNLTLNNANGFTSASPLRITGTLSFVTGNIYTTSSTFIELGSSATITGETGGSMIMGDVHVERALAGSAAAPVSSTFGNIGFGVSNVKNNITGIMVLRRTGPSSIVTTSSAKSVARQWLVTGTGAALTSPMTITASWLASENNGIPLKAILCYSANGSAWSVMSTQVPITNQTIADATSLFGYFTVGNPDNPLPVELTSFAAVSSGKHVILTWHTATEHNNYGFDVERRSREGQWQKASFIAGNGTSDTPHDYAYADAVMAGAYEYRLRQIDRNGAFEYSPMIEVTRALTGEDYIVSQNYPNPFNPATTIRFAVKTAQHAKITIYNALGQEVRTLFNDMAQPERLYAVVFDAAGLPSGSYYYMLHTEDRREVKHMLLVK
jgi:hypothetical protein